jgi:sialidase-1
MTVSGAATEAGAPVSEAAERRPSVYLPAGEIFESVPCPATAENPRHDHQLIFPLQGARGAGSGELMLVWCEYYASRPSHLRHRRHVTDDMPCRISAKLSSDRGRSWGPRFTLQDNIGGQNVKHPCLLRLPSGEVLFFFTVWNTETDRRIMLRRSADDCETWSDPVKVSTLPGFHCINNDHVIRLSTGRIVVPTFVSPIVWKEGEHFLAFCYFSDDDGRTWQRSENFMDLPRRGAEEPSMVELKDGSLHCVLRSTIGIVAQAASHDGGVTWSEPEPTGLPAVASPPLVKRMPDTGDLLLVWNNRPWEGGGHGPRNPLTAAISCDEGATWQQLKDVENRERYDSAYAAVTFLDDEALVTYYHACRATRTGASVVLKVFPISWFYD